MSKSTPAETPPAVWQAGQTLLIDQLGMRIDWMWRSACAVIRFGNKFPWFYPAMTSLGVSDEAIKDCKEIASKLNEVSSITRGNLKKTWLCQALDESPDPSLAVEAVKAFLVLASVSSSTCGVPRKVDLEVIARGLRGTRLKETPFKKWLKSIQTDGQQAVELVSTLNSSLLRQAAVSLELQRTWKKHWDPFLRDLFSGATPVSAPVGIDPEPESVDKDEDDEEIEVPLLFTTLVGKPLDPVDAPEAPEESAPTVNLVECVAGQAGTPAQRLRISNLDLDNQHAEVISDTELRLILPSLWIAAEHDSGRQKLLAVTALLMLATGRAAAETPKILLHRELSEEVTDVIYLNHGTWEFPVLRAPDSFSAPKTQDECLWVSTAPQLSLPLPPRLLAVLSKTKEPSEKSPSMAATFERELESYLRGLTGPRRYPISLRRWRLRFAAELQTQGGDAAKTMLIASNTFGKSPAPLYYYTARSGHLQSLYQQAIWPLLHADAGPAKGPVSTSDTRIGAEGLVRDDIVVAGLTEMQGKIESPLKSKRLARSQVIDLHNQFVRYCVSWIQIVTGHRPTQALAALTRWNFDLAGHGAIVSDKRIDPEHLRRFVATTEALSKQLCLYLAHLDRLSQRTTRSLLIQRCKAAIAGDKPLFFFLDESWNAVSLEIAELKAQLPASWQPLQSNWYRTWLASRLRDFNADPLCIAIQMGHLETGQHPFSHESPIVPLEFSRHLRPALLEVECCLGLRPMRGMAPVPLNGTDQLPTLRHWTQDLAVHRRETDQYGRLSRSSIRKKWLENDRQALSEVLLIIGSIAPRLSDGIQPDCREVHKLEWVDPSPRQGSPVLSAEVLREILEALSLNCSGPSVMASRHNLFWKLTRRARRLWGWAIPAVHRWSPVLLSEPTPFIERVMLARTQVVALREALAHAPANEGELARLAWQTLQLMLQGMSFKEIWALRINGPDLRCRLSGQTDRVIVGDASRILSGLSALTAVSPHRQMKMTAEILEQAVFTLIPQSLASGSTDIFSRIESTVKVAQLVEQSPLARLALDTDSGCTRLSATVAVDFLAGKKIEDVLPVMVSAASSLVSPDQKIVLRSKHAEDRKEYLALLSALNVPKGAPKFFPLTQKSLEAWQVASAKPLVIEEIRLCEASFSSDRLPHYLATFAMQLLTDKRRDLVVSSIHTYLSSIGPGLLSANHECLLTNADPDEIADLYASLIDGLSPRSSTRTAAQCVALHKLLMEKLDLPAIDLRFLWELGSDQATAHADANLISHQESERALQLLLQAAVVNPEGFASVESRRFDRACAAVLVLLRTCGLRISEATLLRHRDVVVDDVGGVVLVRPSGYSWLKTMAARRLCSLDGRLDSNSHEILAMWIRDEIQRQGVNFDANLPLFGSLVDPRLPLGIEAMRRRLIDVLKLASARPVRVHHLRHTSVANSLMSALGFQKNGTPFANTVDSKWSTPAMIRRIKHQIGHRSIKTTVGCYFHLPDAFSTNYPIHTNRRSLVMASGKSQAAVDKLYQRAGLAEYNGSSAVIERQWRIAVLNRLIPESPSLTPVVSQKLSQPIRDQDPFDAVLLERLLRDSRTDQSLGNQCEAMGVTHGTCSALLSAIADLKIQHQYRLLESTTKTHKSKPIRLPRRIGSKDHFDSVLRLADQPDTAESARIVLHGYRRTHPDRLTLSRLDAHRMKVWCERIFAGSQFAPDVKVIRESPIATINFRLKHQSFNATAGLVRCMAIVWVYQRTLDYISMAGETPGNCA